MPFISHSVLLPCSCMPVACVRSTAIVDRMALKSVLMVVPSSQFICGRWFSGPNMVGGRLLLQFLYITLHGGRKQDSVSPSTPGLF